MKNVNQIGWFDIYVSELTRTKKFYETVFNIEFSDLPTQYGKQSAFPLNYKGLNFPGAYVDHVLQHQLDRKSTSLS